MLPGFETSSKHASLARGFWFILIATSGICLSTVFACATPFAALAALAALKLGRRDAITIVVLVWLTNQVVGYALLGYPWTWDSAAWGVAIGASAMLALLAAGGLYSPRPAPFAVSLPFIAAFATFELGLYGTGFVLPGGSGAFAASIVWNVFIINASTFFVLIAAHSVAMTVVSMLRQDAPLSRAAAGA